jgi:mono/diheme cytochrome c family protein
MRVLKGRDAAAIGAVAIGLAGLLGGVVVRGAVAQPAVGRTGSQEEGKRAFKASCAGCHKWHGAGGGGYGGAALSLRKTELTREQIVETIACGRPGTGMPYHVRDAYDSGSCYGMKKADLGKDMPPAADRFLRQTEIVRIVDYVLVHIKGKGEPNLSDCEDFWGEGSRVCGEYRRGAARTGSSTTTRSGG